MKKIIIDFKNCYGIKSLQHEFDTTNGQAFIIYAPNGSMKTSFTKVFEDISMGLKPSDRIFSNRVTTYSILEETGNQLTADAIYVVNPYIESFDSTKTATLLVNQELRKIYENAIKAINDVKQQVMKNLTEKTSIKKNIEQEICDAFGCDEKEIFDLIERIASIITAGNNPGMENVVYTEIFNQKVIDFLSNEEVKKQLQEYMERYKELTTKSTFFRQGGFDNYNAKNISKSLKDNKFFEADHSVLLADKEHKKTEISSLENLDLLLETEKKAILNDPQLVKKFEAIDNAITKNIELRQFRAYLEKNPELISELADLDSFQIKLLISYCFSISSIFLEFVKTYQKSKLEIAKVVEIAKTEETQWRKVVSIFHERFSVPFTLEIVNQDDVILKDATPSLVFKYAENGEKQEIGKAKLIEVLSYGEKRALYLLNIIFDIESIIKSKKETVLVLDDIADSFDYKNKYAIVEYIQSILETNNFIMFILTHNFDFYRTIQSRLGIHRDGNCLMAIKSDDGVHLNKAEYINNPFKYWKQNLHKDNKYLIASIPLVRNLVEYTLGINHRDYKFLTSILHIKKDSNKSTFTDLVTIYNHMLGTTLPNNSGLIIDEVFSQADSCISTTESINLENKIILSIAIRLKAEILMISKINNPSETEKIEVDQTRILYNMVKSQYSNEKEFCTLLERVVLMTPEAIHLNSFMYEPILDMSDCHLITLYSQLKGYKL